MTQKLRPFKLGGHTFNIDPAAEQAIMATMLCEEAEKSWWLGSIKKDLTLYMASCEATEAIAQNRLQQIADAAEALRKACMVPHSDSCATDDDLLGYLEMLYARPFEDSSERHQWVLGEWMKFVESDALWRGLEMLEAAARDGANELKRGSGRPSNHAIDVLEEGIGRAWKRYTGSRGTDSRDKELGEQTGHFADHCRMVIRALSEDKRPKEDQFIRNAAQFTKE